jgi:predicted nucleic acid-binding protein
LIFLDSNILIYASGLHGAEDPRTDISRSIVSSGAEFGISIQVIHEFYDRVIRPKRTKPLPHERAMALIAEWRRFTVLPITLDLFDDAIAIRERYGFRYYDSAIIAAAQALGCDKLYSEDMQNNQRIDFLKIINPFKIERGEPT